MRKTKKTLAILALVAMVFSLIPLQAFGATAATASSRLAGADRIATANQVADAGWTSATTAILAPANDENLVDALAAAPLAGQANAPILLTDKASLDSNTAAELTKLGVTKVYVVGAIQASVVAQVKALSSSMSVVPLQGADRMATAGLIAGQLTSVNGTFVVGYNALADALSAASYAAANGYEIVVAGTDGTVPSSESVKGSTTYVLGGPTLVADIAGATRIFGADRFATNQKVLGTLTYKYDKVYVANGTAGHLVDSLVASSLAAQSDAAIVLCDTNGAAAAGDIKAKLSSSSQVVALGGTSVVPDAVVGTIAPAVPSGLSVTSVTAPNGKQLVIKFNQAVDKDTLIDDSGDYKILKGNLIQVNTADINAADEKKVDVTKMHADLSDDGLTLTLTDVNDATHFDGSYTIYFADGISAVSGALLGSYTTSVSVDDTTAPTVSGITYNSATNMIDVQMSEPVEVAPTVTVNGGAPKSFGDNINTDKTKFSIDASSYDRGSVKTVQASGAVDYLGNDQVGTYSASVTITMNENPVSVTSITQDDGQTVKIVFDKTITGVAGDDTVAGSASSIVKGAMTILADGSAANVTDVTVTRDGDDSTNRTFKVKLNDAVGVTGPSFPFYGGNDSVQLEIIFAKDGLTDVFGNTNPRIDQTLTMNKVTAGPALVYARLAADKQSFELRFDKDIAMGKGGILVLNGGVKQNIPDDLTGGISGKILTIDYLDAAPPAGVKANVPNATYTIHVPKGALTGDGNDNAAFDATVTVNETDNSSTTVLSVANQDTNTFLVTYSAKVGTSAVDATNYTLDGLALPAGTSLYFNDADKTEVVIQLPSSSVDYSSDTSSLRNIDVLDDNGNKVTAVSKTVTVTDNIKPSLVSADLTGNILTLTFDENIVAANTLTSTDELIKVFEIKGGSSGTTLGGGGDVVTSVDGKKLILVMGTSGSNWTTVKALSSLTVKTLDTGGKAEASDVTDSNNADNNLKDGITVTVTKH